MVVMWCYLMPIELNGRVDLKHCIFLITIILCMSWYSVHEAKYHIIYTALQGGLKSIICIGCPSWRFHEKWWWDVFAWEGFSWPKQAAPSPLALGTSKLWGSTCFVHTSRSRRITRQRCTLNTQHVHTWLIYMYACTHTLFPPPLTHSFHVRWFCFTPSSINCQI